jgi:hypothetical protein
MALAGLRRVCRTVANHNKRVQSVGDNMAELAASEKGRARDYALRAILVCAAAFQLACGVRWRQRHMDTK